MAFLILAFSSLLSELEEGILQLQMYQLSVHGQLECGQADDAQSGLVAAGQRGPRATCQTAAGFL
jgi:hypothetical protein